MSYRIYKLLGGLFVAFCLLGISAGAYADEKWLKDWKHWGQGGNAEYQYKVALYYMNRGIYRAGIEWYQMAANSGYPDAEFDLANMYLEGSYVPKSFEKALYWFKRSAEHGSAKGQEKVGIMYENGGFIGKKNPIEAYKWLKLSVRGGNLVAAEELSELENEMTPQQIEEAEAQVRQYQK